MGLCSCGVPSAREVAAATRRHPPPPPAAAAITASRMSLRPHWSVTGGTGPRGRTGANCNVAAVEAVVPSIDLVGVVVAVLAGNATRRLRRRFKPRR